VPTDRQTPAATRRGFLGTVAAATVGRVAAARVAPAQPRASGGQSPSVPAFELDEATVTELQQAMAGGRRTARQITQLYLDRIAAIDRSGPQLRSVIEANPDALAIADRLDAERRAGKLRGPLHGIPILIKDNIATADRMTTTAGSLALEGSIAPKDSFVASRLREAGAILLGKANLSEWANIRSNHSSSGWSARGGQCRNPYVLDRNPCGSSSGSGAAVAANLAVAAIGTETNGSIVCPASSNGVVGLKPTVGLVSRSRIIPISHSQDTAGPMARTVRDAALLLAALTGVDPEDEATAASTGRVQDYAAALDASGLQGARIGVARQFFGFNPDVDALMAAALDAIRAAGATLVDVRLDGMDEADRASFEVLLYELKADLAVYLATLGPNAPVKSLADVIAFNRAHRDREMPFFDQDIFELAEQKGPLTDRAYLEALATSRRITRTAIDGAMEAERLVAIVAPAGGPAWVTDHVNGDHFSGGSSSPAAIAGYPNISVPAGAVRGLPVGLSFFGRAWSEAALLRVAYAFEQATRHRTPPSFLPTLGA
jgi:amidase